MILLKAKPSCEFVRLVCRLSLLGSDKLRVGFCLTGSMAELFLHKRKVASVFHLLGEHENDITYSMAWALSQSPRFLNTFLKQTIGFNADPDKVTIRLQHHEKQAGITDIEIESPGLFFLIVEAKRGWNLPSLKQLQIYACRRSFTTSDGAVKRILPLSDCNREYALHAYGCNKIAGIDLQPTSWKEMVTLAQQAQKSASHAEKRLLRELLTYLRGLMNMQDIDSNWVYVVSLGPGTPEGWSISWIDIVKKKRAYFHPVGGTWPKEPLNYVGFRYNGKLQSIHHVEKADIFKDPHDKFPEIPSVNWPPHFLYKLGPEFAPAREVKTGTIYPNGRVWCMLDTLFTSQTISQARDISKMRSEKSQ